MEVIPVVLDKIKNNDRIMNDPQVFNTVNSFFKSSLQRLTGQACMNCFKAFRYDVASVLRCHRADVIERMEILKANGCIN